MAHSAASPAHRNSPLPSPSPPADPPPDPQNPARPPCRLRTLTGVLDDPHGYILRMRRLAGAGARLILSLRPARPNAASAKPGSPARMIIDLQDTCMQAADYLDTG